MLGTHVSKEETQGRTNSLVMFGVKKTSIALIKAVGSDRPG